ncbi:YbdD/YjiX family protein [Cryobacterium sp. MDB2-A-1]|uniref:YbdD/YjiX family protein n=2 Tax=Cryobacterium TaxID=69578 RepID=UPI0035178FFC
MTAGARRGQRMLSAGGTSLAALLGGIRRAARSVAWYVKGVMGEDAWDKYRAHHEAAHGTADPAHPTERMMTEREFWRDQTDRQDANPQGRCC